MVKDKYIYIGKLLFTFFMHGIISVGIGSNTSVIASFHVANNMNCFFHCCHEPTCTGYKFNEKFSSESDVNCVLMNNVEEDMEKGGEWVYYKAIMVSYRYRWVKIVEYT